MGSTPTPFAAARGGDGLPRVRSAMRAAKRLGFAPLKLNAVAMPDTDYAALVRFAACEGVHLRWIRLMAIGEVRPWQAAADVSADDLLTRIVAAGISLHERPDRGRSDRADMGDRRP